MSDASDDATAAAADGEPGKVGASGGGTGVVSGGVASGMGSSSSGGGTVAGGAGGQGAASTDDAAGNDDDDDAASAALFVEFEHAHQASKMDILSALHNATSAGSGTAYPSSSHK